MSKPLQVLRNRKNALPLPPLAEIERFGNDGEEQVYRLLKENFSCVKRNVVAPHKDLLLEKDFMVVEQGVTFVLEVKNWKGEIGMEGDRFYQIKDNGVKKLQKSPVGTTRQFIRCMREAYDISSPVFGMVVFLPAGCTPRVPAEVEEIALLPLSRMVPYIRTMAKASRVAEKTISSLRVLTCTRFYDEKTEFCKGVVANKEIECFDALGNRLLLDTSKMAYLSVEPQPLLMRDKLYVTFSGGNTGVFYNRDAVLYVKLLDGSFDRISVNRVRHIVF